MGKYKIAYDKILDKGYITCFGLLNDDDLFVKTIKELVDKEIVVDKIDLDYAQHILNNFIEDESNKYEITGYFCKTFQSLIDTLKE